MHTWETLVASVQGFRQHFDVQPVNSLCVLPLYHVSGLMQFLRSLTSGGRFAIAPFKTLESGTYPEIQPEEFFLSLVPTQLQRLLSGAKISSGAVAESASELTSGKSHSAFISPHSSVSVEWLGRFKAILLGGAPAWDSLLEQARRDRLPLAPTYGMTETASQIATLKPAEFLQGMTGCGQILPHAHAIIGDTLGNSLPTGQIGRVRIRAQSLAWGYYPESWQPAKSTPHAPSLAAAPAVSETREFETDDLGYLDHQGYLHILGRSSDKIITGGENVFPAEVEAAIRATGLVQDVCVMGVNDRDWGQMVAAVYVPSRSDVNSAQMTLALASRLSRFKQPKRWLAVSQLPRNAQGKINREAVKEILSREWGIEGMGSGEAWGDGGDAKSGISSVSQSLTNNPKSKIQNSDS
jgi:O-succinylbenzoic acid--CoA ligase